VIWVSIALFTRQDDPDQRASINRIYPERNTSRIERIALPITLNGVPDSVGSSSGGRSGAETGRGSWAAA
jgi:hypothetical protein